MSILNNLKKKAEGLVSESSKIADKTIKNATVRAEQAIKDTKEWTEQTMLSSKEWSSRKAKDITDFASETWDNAGKYADDMKNWTKEMPDKLHTYSDNFNIEDFWNKIAETAKKVGQDLIFMALACFYALSEFFKKPESDEALIEKPAVTEIKVKAKTQNRTALGVMHAYLALYPDTTLEKIREVFPNDIAPDKGVKEMFASEETANEINDKMTLYFSKEKELLNFCDGSRAALCTMWTKPSLLRLCEKAALFNIETERLGMSPNSQGFELEKLG